MKYQYVIENGTVMDPKSNLCTVANIGIVEDKIAIITRSQIEGTVRIDATNRIVCPGFIDPHNHSDGQIFSGQVLARMGVTSIIVGSCGSGPHPVKPFLERIDQKGYPINCGTLAPTSEHIREAVGITDPFGIASKEQIEKMCALAEQDLEDGAFGISFGLEYAPNTQWDEIIALSRVVAKYDKVIPVHSRAGGWGSLKATAEVIRIQEETGGRVLLSHHAYQCANGMMRESLDIIEKARERGLPIMVDSGAYAAFAAPLNSEVFCEGWTEIYNCDYSDLVVYTGPYTGQRLTKELFEEVKIKDPDAGVTAFIGRENEVVLALQQPYVMISTDGGWPTLTEGEGHPQTAGTYPKILGRFVREQNALTLMDVIAKATWNVAQFFKLENKGWIGTGADADLVIFDPYTILDTANYIGMGNPLEKPVGIEYVFVNGKPIIEEGRLNEEVRAGKALRQANQCWNI